MLPGDSTFQLFIFNLIILMTLVPIRYTYIHSRILNILGEGCFSDFQFLTCGHNLPNIGI